MKLFFSVLIWNLSIPYDFGSLNPNPASVFPHHVEILQYCQFHGCQVRKSVFRVLWKNYKRYRKFNFESPMCFQISRCPHKTPKTDFRTWQPWNWQYWKILTWWKKTNAGFGSSDPKLVKFYWLCQMCKFL